MRLTVPEVIKIINDGPDYQSRVNAILNLKTPVVEQLLQYALWDNIQFDLPSGTPPYKRDNDAPLGMSYTTLERESSRLYLFLKGHAKNLPKIRREQLFVDLLEGLHPIEADFILAVKNKTFETLYPNVTYELVYSTIPNLLPPPETRLKKVAPVTIVEPQFEVISVEKVTGDSSEQNLTFVQRWTQKKEPKPPRLKKDGTPWGKGGPPKKVRQ